MSDMNRQLLEVYSRVLDNDIGSRLADEPDLGGPLLVEVPDAYCKAKVKLMIVGQQTAGWGHPADDSIKDLLGQYRGFELGRRMRSPFWQAAHEIYNCLNPNGPPRGFLWSNLVKVDVNKKKPSPELEELIASTCLLQHELCITKPDVVVFFTGPDYDNRLKAAFPCVKFQQVKDFDLRCLARLNHLKDDKKYTKACRSYHPGYLRRSKQWHVIAEIKTLLRDLLREDEGT